MYKFFKKIILLSYYSIFLENLEAMSQQKVNISDNVPPQSSISETGNANGLIIELAKAIFNNVHFEGFPLARALEVTTKEENSILFISRTAQREEKFNWIDTIYMTPVYIYTKKGKIPQEENYLNFLKSIAVINGSSLIQTLQENKYTGELSTSLTNEQNLKKIAFDRVDGWIEGKIIFEYIIKKEKNKIKNFDKFGPIIKNTTWIATSKKSDNNFINKTKEKINLFKNQKKYNSILLKYSADKPET